MEFDSTGKILICDGGIGADNKHLEPIAPVEERSDGGSSGEGSSAGAADEEQYAEAYVIATNSWERATMPTLTPAQQLFVTHIRRQLSKKVDKKAGTAIFTLPTPYELLQSNDDSPAQVVVVRSRSMDAKDQYLLPLPILHGSPRLGRDRATVIDGKVVYCSGGILDVDTMLASVCKYELKPHQIIQLAVGDDLHTRCKAMKAFIQALIRAIGFK